nr:hypothetical protein [Vibrio cincinnatiensis]
MVKVLCGSFCIACLRPLTRRYVFLSLQKEICSEGLWRYPIWKLFQGQAVACFLRH